MKFQKKICRDGGTLLPQLSRPKSKGNIHLKSKDPHVPPVIEQNYYSDPRDVATMREGLKWGYKMTKTSTFVNKKIKPIVDKFGCGAFEPFSDAYFECSLSHWSHTVYHPAGTCKMGPTTDPFAVVNAELQVYGIENLRVIDASIMPTIVGCNTNAPTIMIGEKGSNMIIEKWVDAKENKKQKHFPKTEL